MELSREQNQINKFIGLAESIFISHYNYRVLGEEEDRTKILTKTVPDYFNFINNLLINDFFLQVTRIIEDSSSSPELVGNLMKRLMILRKE